MIIELITFIAYLVLVKDVCKFLYWLCKNYQPLKNFGSLVSFYVMADKRKPILQIWREVKKKKGDVEE